MVNKFVENTQNTNKTQFLASNYEFILPFESAEMFNFLE